jgi:hypothetical protein
MWKIKNLLSILSAVSECGFVLLGHCALCSTSLSSQNLKRTVRTQSCTSLVSSAPVDSCSSLFVLIWLILIFVLYSCYFVRELLNCSLYFRTLDMFAHGLFIIPEVGMKSILTWSCVHTHGRSQMAFSQIPWFRSRWR